MKFFMSLTPITDKYLAKDGSGYHVAILQDLEGMFVWVRGSEGELSNHLQEVTSQHNVSLVGRYDSINNEGLDIVTNTVNHLRRSPSKLTEVLTAALR